VEKDGLNFGT